MMSTKEKIPEFFKTMVGNGLITIKKEDSLFSEYYLQKWAENLKDENNKLLENFATKLTNILRKKPSSEGETETQFIKPVFKLLGFKDLREKCNIDQIVQPDEVYYENTESHEKKRLEGILVITEAKPVSQDLNKYQKQLIDYISRAYARSNNKVKWGILTNGYSWRLYRFNKSGYIEFDLKKIIGLDEKPDDLFKPTSETKEFAIKLFYILFNRQAFVTNAEFLEKIYDQALDHQKQVEDNLHKQAYPALIAIFNGYWQKIKDDVTDENRYKCIEKAYEDSIYYLYRLLFLFYAKGKNLKLFSEKSDVGLDSDYQRIFSESVKNAPIEYKKDTISFYIDNDNFSKDKSNFNSKLQDIFEWLNKGHKKRDIQEFNGDLFKPRKIDDFELSDYYLSIALRLLAYSPEGESLDYQTLDVQHLGNIYERLLLFDKPKEDYEFNFYFKGAVDKGKYLKLKFPFNEKWIYFDVDPTKKKSTGTYYTPDYIVQYIVQNTVGKKLDEIFNSDVENKLDKILSLKILDPAMGSGHFLVRAVDCIAKFIIEKIGTITYSDNSVRSEHFGDITKYFIDSEPITPCGSASLCPPLQGGQSDSSSTSLCPPNQGIPSTKLRNRVAERSRSSGGCSNFENQSAEGEIFWKRIIVKRCIYGVDLNKFAVELAKLSLWLHTLSEDKPLQFLDHHLKCGNSLIGIWDVKDVIYSDSERYKKFINAVKGYAHISNLKDSKIKDVQDSLDLYKESRKTIEIFINALNARLAVKDFMNFEEIKDKGSYAFLVAQSAYPECEEHKDYQSALEIAKNLRFFHWKLEFPEVWFQNDEKNPELENGGFDVVIGNPPWISFSGRQSVEISEEERKYYHDNYETSGWLSTHSLFIEQCVQRLSSQYFSFVVPDQVGHLKGYSSIREILANSSNLVDIYYWGEDIFKNVVSPCLTFVTNKNFKDKTLIHWLDGDEKETIIIGNAIWRPFEQKVNIDNLRKDSFSLGHLVADPGVHTGNCSEKLILSNENASLDSVPILEGKQISRYFCSPTKKVLRLKYEKKDDEYFNIKLEIKYTDALFVVRQTAPYIIVAKRDYAIYFRNSLLALYPPKNEIHINYIVAILNSKLMRYIYTEIVQESHQKVFPQVKVGYLKQLPIKKINSNNEVENLYHNKLVNLVDDIIKIAKDRYILEKLESEQFIENSGSWKESCDLLDDLTVKNTREMKKQEINKLASEQINLLTEKFNNTDKEIDQLVYELYDITPDEIQIIEDSLKI